MRDRIVVKVLAVLALAVVATDGASAKPYRLHGVRGDPFKYETLRVRVLSPEIVLRGTPNQKSGELSVADTAKPVVVRFDVMNIGTAAITGVEIRFTAPVPDVEKTTPVAGVMASRGYVFWKIKRLAGHQRRSYYLRVTIKQTFPLRIDATGRLNGIGGLIEGEADLIMRVKN